MNVECGKDTLDELTGAFRFSDAVIRHLVIAMPGAVTEPSPMAKTEEEEGGGRGERGERGGQQDDAEDSASAG
jgi:small subunit ribosomal protein S6